MICVSSQSRLRAVRVLVFAGAALLAGCGSMYYAAKTSSTAGLRFTNASLMGEAGAGIFDNPQCIGGKTLGVNNVAKGGHADYVLDAGQPITFVAYGDRGTEIRSIAGSLSADVRQCYAPGRFTPAPGGRYEMVFHDDGRQCSFEIADVSTGSRRAAPSETLAWRSPTRKNPKADCE